jgi:hypothetical protein
MFQQLNDKFYALFSDLFASRAVLPEKQYAQMSDALMAEYRRELEEVTDQIMLDTARQTYEQKLKIASFCPHGFWIWKNPVAKAIKKQVRAEFRQYVYLLEHGGELPPEPSPMSQESSSAVVPVSVDPPDHLPTDVLPRQ